MSTLKEFGRRLREVRLDKRMTQAEVAKLAGIHVNYYAKIERGEVNPTLEVIHMICISLKVKANRVLPF